VPRWKIILILRIIIRIPLVKAALSKSNKLIKARLSAAEAKITVDPRSLSAAEGWLLSAAEVCLPHRRMVPERSRRVVPERSRRVNQIQNIFIQIIKPARS
jgi:hypothetical protein